jgi:hypothetical protein
MFSEAFAMQMKLGKRWICMNRECACEVIVALTGEFEGTSIPRCCCGTVMKTPYVRPIAKELMPVGRDGPPAKMFRSMSRHAGG